jgi:hypothetical protein
LKEGINESGGFVRSGKWCGRRAFPTADLRRRMILRPAEFVARPQHCYGMSGIGPEANPWLSPYLLKADGAERREKRSRSEKASLKKGGEARASMLFGAPSFPIGLRAAGAELLPTFSGAVLKKCAHSDIYIGAMTTQPLLANLADASPGVPFFSLAFPCVGLRAAEAGPLPTFSGAFLKKCTRFGVNSSSMTSHPLMTDSGDAGSSLPFLPATFPCGCPSKKGAVGFLGDRGRDLGSAALYRHTLRKRRRRCLSAHGTPASSSLATRALLGAWAGLLWLMPSGGIWSGKVLHRPFRIGCFHLAKTKTFGYDDDI